METIIGIDEVFTENHHWFNNDIVFTDMSQLFQDIAIEAEAISRKRKRLQNEMDGPQYKSESASLRSLWLACRGSTNNLDMIQLKGDRNAQKQDMWLDMDESLSEQERNGEINYQTINVSLLLSLDYLKLMGRSCWANLQIGTVIWMATKKLLDQRE